MVDQDTKESGFNNDVYMSIFSKQFVKVLRGGISIYQLAKDTGISATNLYRIKRGGDLTFDNAIKIARACKKSISFFTQEGANDQSSQEGVMERIIMELDSMSVNQRDLFFKYVLPTYLRNNKYTVVSHDTKSHVLSIVPSEGEK